MFNDDINIRSSNIKVVLFFKILEQFDLNPDDWIKRMLPGNQGWDNFKPQYRNPKLGPFDFFEKVAPEHWPLSSFLIGKHPNVKKIIKMANYWNSLLKDNSNNMRIIDKKLKIKFDT
jgi:hypothetical protein